MKLSKKLLGVTLAGTLAVGSIGLTNLEPEEVEAKKDPKVKNVIVLVKDGVSSTTTTLSRWYKGDDLAMDQMASGGVRTYSAESAVTDSAPAGTAMATGNKTNDKFVGVLPEKIASPGVDEDLADDPYRPVTNVLEGAKLNGKATGIISTSEIQHATPAAFSSHADHRSQYDNIAEQQVYQNIDVVLGGGKESLENGNRDDGEDLLGVIDDKGYDYVETRDDLLDSRSKKIWGSFAPAALAYDMDREATKPEEPTLAEMTKKSIQTLSKDKDGFFLMVEGSKPDWAAHANDPVGMISDTLSFDDAVKEALDFAKKDKNTMVIAVSDHGNSGISIGNENTDGTYSSTPVSAYVDPLKEATMTLEGAMSQLNEDGSNRLEVAELYGITNPTAKEKRAINKSEDLGGTLVDLLAQRANLGFTTGGHTGEDLFLYSYGPGKPSGMIENTDIAHSAADAMGFKLDKLSKNMFIEAEEAFGKWGEVSVDTSDAANPVLVIDKGRKKAEFPVNKNVVIVNDREYELDSVTVQSGGDFYVSKDAVKIVKKAK
ncbi:alkaline phosphatase [Terribacillus sp. AE2B 122]|uniref:alkaline phosphatase n=1 Tax=Terribacillus sp. AE2B 122 TaxID=1331902 RepID=UPI001440C9E1|nr:alkaline phosphatase [Terribacillus sp. AE2B 122]VVM33717.1 Alkaline phosphatase (EC 3.1.3.1) [Terribacillus sp. AE2B 122]